MFLSRHSGLCIIIKIIVYLWPETIFYAVITNTFFCINPRTAKLFQLTFAAKGGGCCNPPWILVFPTDFLREIFHGYSFGVKESKGDS